MKRSVMMITMTLGSILVGPTCLPAWAVGPLNGEVGAVWWENDVDSTGGASAMDEGAAAPGYRAEVWLFERYGLRAGRHGSDPETSGAADSSYTSLDLLWKPFSPSQNSFMAVGAGWQDLDLGSVGLGDNTSGARVSIEGRVSFLTVLYAYAQGSYFPALEDSAAANPANGRFEDLDGHDYEAGVSWKAAPFMRLRAGFRETRVDFRRRDPLGAVVDGHSTSRGFLVGLGFHF